MEYYSIKDLVNLAVKNNTTISEIVIQTEIDESEQTQKEINQKMYDNIDVMKEAVNRGKKGNIKSESGLIGGQSSTLSRQANIFSGNIYHKAVINALAVAEVNACMGKIVACPTAGSCGIIPGVLLAVQKELGKNDEELCKALFTASGLGRVIANKATLAGAAGGCQAECGSAAAMAAGGVVELINGNPEIVSHAFALALKNLLGLVCDPVAGLVEIPCVKRNGFAAAHALTAVDMALAGIKSAIPADEVIEAMEQIGRLLPDSLKETARGGLAITETGKKIRKDCLK